MSDHIMINEGEASCSTAEQLASILSDQIFIPQHYTEKQTEYGRSYSYHKDGAVCNICEIPYAHFCTNPISRS